MTGPHFPWLELGVLVPAIGAIVVFFLRDAVRARRWSIRVSGLALAVATAGWADFGPLHTFSAHDAWNPVARLPRTEAFAVDQLSAPLLPLAALLYFLTHLATLRAKAREFSFARSLASESLLLATLSVRSPWGVVALLAASVLPPFLELRAAGKPTRVFSLHMLAFVLLLVAGQVMLSRGGGFVGGIGVVLLTGAVLLRSGVAPAHCWMPDLFEHATFGTALLFVTPMVGAYGMTRLVLHVAPTWLLAAITVASLLTAFYAAGMALVQKDARRFFCYLFLSHSSLVLVGLETAIPIGLVGALWLWLSVSVSLTGFGLTMRCIETRVGRVSLLDFHGLYHQVPMLAALFLLMGLASVGFPGTAGFVGLELLIEGAVRANPLAGAMVVVVAALNGLAVLHAYFRIFTGGPHPGTIDIQVRRAERVSVLLLTTIILAGGLYPRPGLRSRYHAAVELARQRDSAALSPPAEEKVSAQGGGAGLVRGGGGH
jgi:NADH-quinone oxidoreductase subunit M